MFKVLHRTIDANKEPLFLRVDLQDLYISRVRKRAGKMTLDPSHPAHFLFELLPSGRRYRALSTKTARHKNSFSPRPYTTWSKHNTSQNFTSVNNFNLLIAHMHIHNSVYWHFLFLYIFFYYYIEYCLFSLLLVLYYLKGVVDCFFSRLDCVYGVQSSMCSCLLFLKTHYFSHNLPLFYTSLSLLWQTPRFISWFYEAPPSEIRDGLRLVSWLSVLWFAKPPLQHVWTSRRSPQSHVLRLNCKQWRCL